MFFRFNTNHLFFQRYKNGLKKLAGAVSGKAGLHFCVLESPYTKTAYGDVGQLSLKGSYRLNTQAHISTYNSLYPKNRCQIKRFFRLLFHAQFFRYEVLGIYLVVDPVGLEPTKNLLGANEALSQTELWAQISVL